MAANQSHFLQAVKWSRAIERIWEDLGNWR